MIDIEDLFIKYPQGKFELSIPRVNIDVGEKVALIGPSGSGKTTLLNIIAGILPVCRGEIKVCNNRIDQLQDEQRRAFRIENIGFVFQDLELLNYLTVGDNILLPYRINPALNLTKDVVSRAEALLDKVGLPGKYSTFPHHLSQGEKQRAAICRALITQPKLLLADEATGNLDPRNKERIMDLLYEYVNQTNATLVAATHDHTLLPGFGRTLDFQEFHRTSKVYHER